MPVPCAWRALTEVECLHWNYLVPEVANTLWSLAPSSSCYAAIVQKLAAGTAASFALQYTNKIPGFESGTQINQELVITAHGPYACEAILQANYSQASAGTLQEGCELECCTWVPKLRILRSCLKEAAPAAVYRSRMRPSGFAVATLSILARPEALQNAKMHRTTARPACPIGAPTHQNHSMVSELVKRVDPFVIK